MAESEDIRRFLHHELCCNGLLDHAQQCGLVELSQLPQQREVEAPAGYAGEGQHLARPALSRSDRRWTAF